MKILIISPGYPTNHESDYSFVKQLVEEWANQGNDCTLISTYSVVKHKRFQKYKTVSVFPDGGKVTIYRPNILTFSNIRIFKHSLTNISHQLGMSYSLNQLDGSYDFVYCHFWRCGADGVKYSSKFGKPLFIASGESNIKLLFDGIDKSFIRSVKGVICVSSKNREESVSLGLASEDLCGIFPNSINPHIFHKRDKHLCRQLLGIPDHHFVIAFVGAFKESKGPIRLSQALAIVNKNHPVYSLFIGAGPQEPSAPNIIHKGSLLHESIPIYLSAADVFVLPTLAEGCCNAIIEAMACGLPIISSNLSFNWDILNNQNSILIDPYNIDEIAKAIETLRNDNKLRQIMSIAALKTAEELTINKRAKNILDFIKLRMQ